MIAPAVVKRRRGKGLQKCAKTSAERTRDCSMKMTRIIRDTYLMLPRGYRAVGDKCSKYAMMTQVNKFVRRVNASFSQDL